MPRKFNTLENILSRTQKDEESGCLNYEGSVNQDGYPLISFQGKMCSGGRLVYKLYYGPIPKGFEVDHTCYNRRCLEKSHLRLLTHRDNVIKTEWYAMLRDARLTTLLGVYPQIEFYPISLTSKELGNLWVCRSDHVASVLCTMTEAYREQFSWQSLAKGRRGRKAARFEVRISPSLVERLLSEEEEDVVASRWGESFVEE